MLRWLQRLSALPVVALAAATGCAGVDLDRVREDVAAGHGHLVRGVPFIPQEDFQCGPAALAMVLRYHGVEADPGEIARALYLPSVRGTLNLELEFYARRRGLRAHATEATLASAKAELRRDRPLVVFQDLGATLGAGPLVAVPHFAVLLGYDDRAGVVVLHSGTTPHRVLSYAEFERTWAARGRWALLVSRPDG